MKILFLTRKYFPSIGGVEVHVKSVAEELAKDGHTITIIAERESDKEDQHLVSNWHSGYTNDNYKDILNNIDKSIKSAIFRIIFFLITSFFSVLIFCALFFYSIAYKLLRPLLCWQKKYITDKFQNQDSGLINSNNKNIRINSDSNIILQHIPLVKNTWNKRFVIWWWLFQKRKLIKEADIVHCHDVGFWYFPFFFLYPDKKFYITFHGYETMYPPQIKAKIIRKITGIMASGNICIGKYITKWYNTHADFISYGGVTLPASVQSAQPRSIVFIGRLEEDIGIAIYLNALAILDRRKIPYKITFCGDGSLKKKCQKYGHVTGFVKNVDKYIVTADIIFASSYLSILQGFVYKKPVVAVYTNPLKKDYLTLTPFAKWLVIAYDPRQVADYLIDRRNISYSKEAYQWSHAQSWHQVTGLYYKLWQK